MENENQKHFCAILERHYVSLFETPHYAYLATRTTPDALALKITESLIVGTANKDGDGIKRTCKDLGIAYTYKAIRAYLGQMDFERKPAYPKGRWS